MGNPLYGSNKQDAVTDFWQKANSAIDRTDGYGVELIEHTFSFSGTDNGGSASDAASLLPARDQVSILAGYVEVKGVSTAIDLDVGVSSGGATIFQSGGAILGDGQVYGTLSEFIANGESIHISLDAMASTTDYTVHIALLTIPVAVTS